MKQHSQKHTLKWAHVYSHTHRRGFVYTSVHLGIQCLNKVSVEHFPWLEFSFFVSPLMTSFPLLKADGGEQHSHTLTHRQTLSHTFLCGVVFSVIATGKLWAPFSCVFSQRLASLWTHSSLEHKATLDLLWSREERQQQQNKHTHTPSYSSAILHQATSCNLMLHCTLQGSLCDVNRPVNQVFVFVPGDAAAWCVSRAAAAGWSGWSRTWRTDSSGPWEDRRTTAWPHILDLNLAHKHGQTNTHK